MADMTPEQAFDAIDTARRDLMIAAEYQGNKAAAESGPQLAVAAAVLRAELDGLRHTSRSGPLFQEAADILRRVSEGGHPLPDNWRWPLLDELEGLAAIDAAKGASHEP